MKLEQIHRNILVPVFFLVNQMNCARILGVIPTPSISHQTPFRPLWKELSLRGHQVVVITTDPVNNQSLTNLTEIDVHFAYKIESWNKNLSEEYISQNPLVMLNTIIHMFCDVCKQELNHPEVQKLIANQSEHFDLVMIEILHPIMYGFQDRFKCPFIGLVSMDAQLAAYDLVGSPAHPILNPDFMLPFAGELNFFERILSYIYSVLIRWYGDSYIFPVTEKILQEVFGYNARLTDIVQNLAVILVNVNPLFHGIRPVVPAIINIGGGMHLNAPKPLPKDLQQYLDEAKEGVIYFSLGSNVKSKDIPDEIRKAIIETFSELPYSILWKFEADNLEGKPNNVKIMKWMPQQDILRHPNVKLFITQGGLQSTEEAIFSHVPMIGMPFFGDQLGNVKKMVLKGLGLHIDHRILNKSTFKKAILEVINNPEYRENIKKVAELAQDQPMTGLERAVWWTEYVIRHKGAKHLRSPAIDMPAYQYYLLDVIGFLVLVLVTILYIFIKLVKLIYRLLRKLTNKKVKTN